MTTSDLAATLPHRAVSWYQRLGGPYAFTWWSWGLTAPVALALSGLSVPPGYDGGFATLGTAINHVLLGGLLLLARSTVIGPHRTGRPALTLAIFAAATGVKPVLFNVMSILAGQPVLPGLPARVVSNMVPGTVLLVVIAVAVDAARTRQQVEEHLATTLAAVNRQAEDDELRVATMRDDVAAALRTRLDAALADIPGARVPGSAATTLVALADEVVRPFAHALFDEVPPVQVPQRRTPVQRYAAALRALATPHPVAPVVLFVAVSVPHLLLSGHPLPRLVLAGLAMVAVNVVSGAVLRWPQRPWLRTAGVLGSSVLAAAAGIGTWLALARPAESIAVAVATLAFYPGIAVAFSLVQTAERDRVHEHEQLAAALVERSRAAAHSRERLLRARQQVALAMHSAVQSELFGAALRLTEDSEPVDLGAVVQRAVDQLRSRQRVEQAAMDRLTGLLDAWSTSRRVDRELAPAAVDLLETDDDLAERVVDVVSEALVNAAKHAARPTSPDAPDIAVRLRVRDDAVVVRVTSSGPAAPRRRGNGLGLVHVERASRSWRVTEVDGTFVLEAELVGR